MVGPWVISVCYHPMIVFINGPVDSNAYIDINVEGVWVVLYRFKDSSKNSKLWFAGTQLKERINQPW